MNNIGGYFGLELSKGDNAVHTSSYTMKSGRSSLSFLLDTLRPEHVYLPFYTCDALLEPFVINKIRFTFYAIDGKFELEILPVLKSKEMLVYIDYFGLKDAYVRHLSDTYTDKLIVDCTQAYFTQGNGRSWFFNSARKFFGVPDGSDLYIPDKYNLDDAFNKLGENSNYITDHLIARFNGNAEKGYPYFQHNEWLNGGRAARMSHLTSRLLSHVNFVMVRETRIANFNFLHTFLKRTNQLQLSFCSDAVPFFYPYLPLRPIDKKKLWDVNIFIPILWSDCLNRKGGSQFVIEKQLSENLIPIPIDHRYSYEQLNEVVTTLEITEQ